MNKHKGMKLVGVWMTEKEKENLELAINNDLKILLMETLKTIHERRDIQW